MGWPGTTANKHENTLRGPNCLFASPDVLKCMCVTLGLYRDLENQDQRGITKHPVCGVMCDGRNLLPELPVLSKKYRKHLVSCTVA